MNGIADNACCSKGKEKYGLSLMRYERDLFVGENDKE